MTVLVEGKKLCLRRCLTAVAYSIGVQFLLLGVFLFFINFQALHPWQWICSTLSVLFSPFTWLSIIPLISAVIIYGILLGKSFLNVKRYYPTRFKWLIGTAPRKMLFLLLHLLVGLLTAWLYAGYMHQDYRHLICDCYGSNCINSRYLFLVCVGILASSLHFVKENLFCDPVMEFPIIQEMTLIKMRSLLYSTLYQSMIKSFLPTVCFGFAYWLLGGFINGRLAIIFAVDIDESLQTFFSIAGNVRLLFYGWLLAAQVLSNMHLMQHFYSILLSEAVKFPLAKTNVLCNVSYEEITLVDALSMTLVPVVQNLGALDVYNISNVESAERRQELFALSVPGGHPYNWNQLSAQCLCLVNAFTEEFAASVKKVSTVKCAQMMGSVNPVTAGEAAERILLRQYNDIHGIRRLGIDEPCPNPDGVKKMSPACKQIHDQIEKLRQQVEKIMQKAFHTIPGIFYMFGESDDGKTAFLLSNSQTIVWVVQGLAGICVASLTEDRYGVVQVTLPQIIKSLLKLKSELDKINIVGVNGKKLDRNFITLKGVVKRSLYQICTLFRDYLREIIGNEEDLRKLQCFVYYQAV